MTTSKHEEKAGAVACTCSTSSVAHGHHGGCPYRRAPPAAVPVEALEGLVERWRKEDCRDLPGINNTRIAVDTLLDELTTLIKERSNG